MNWLVMQTTSQAAESIEPLLRVMIWCVFIKRFAKFPRRRGRAYAVRLAAATRPGRDGVPDFVNEWVSWGAGLRAAQTLVLGAKARALLNGNAHVSLDDIRALAHPTLRHRVLLSYRAEAEGVSIEDVIDRLLTTVASTTY